MNNQEEKKIRFYGRRQGKKLSPARLFLLENLLPRIAINIDDLKKQKEINPFDLFDNKPEKLWLEVGFGGGEHAYGQALKNPSVGIIASEVFINGIASLLAHVAGSHEDGKNIYNQNVDDIAKIKNIKILPDDARLLLPILPAACFDKIFVLFPDPWPKNRHEERRFINSDNIKEIARLLKDGGELRVASDDMSYIRWTLFKLNNHQDFYWRAEQPEDWKNPPQDWVATRYESKALADGRKPIYLRFIRKNRNSK